MACALVLEVRVNVEISLAVGKVVHLEDSSRIPVRERHDPLGQVLALELDYKADESGEDLDQDCCFVVSRRASVGGGKE